MKAPLLSLYVLVLFALLACKTPAGTNSSPAAKNTGVNDFGILSEPVNPTGQQVAFVNENMAFEEFEESAKEEGKPYWVYFYADWCKPCKRLSAYTFSDPSVIDFSDSKLMAYKVDVDQFTGMDIAERFEVTEYPTILLFSADGELKEKLEGFMTADVLLAKMKTMENN